MTLAFALIDAFGLPIANSPNAPDTQGFVSGIQTPNTAGYQVSYSDAWIAVPAGITSISFTPRGFGNTSSGLYAGISPWVATKRFWNNVGYPTLAIDLTGYPELCGRKIMFVRMFTANGYLNGGYFLQWDIGAGFVGVPVANTFGQQPAQSRYP